MLTKAALAKISVVFDQGGIIAYPTEAVFGLGCDPDNTQAIERLLKLKQRSANKGLILIAADYAQLQPYIDEVKITVDKYQAMLARWPDAITQIVPAKKDISPLLTGMFDSLAVRVSDHPDVIALCNKVNKPIISTSANLSNQETARTWQQVELQFGEQIDYLIKGDNLGLLQPSTIIDAISGKVIRS